MAEKCKKCGKDLPNNYKGDICGYCKNKEIDKTKNAVGILTAIATVISIILFKK